jgi:hypothetical protein
MAADLFIACDHLIDLLIVRWKVSRTPNLDRPIGHVHCPLVQLVLVPKNGIVLLFCS